MGFQSNELPVSRDIRDTILICHFPRIDGEPAGKHKYNGWLNKEIWWVNLCFRTIKIIWSHWVGWLHKYNIMVKKYNGFSHQPTQWDSIFDGAVPKFVVGPSSCCRSPMTFPTAHRNRKRQARGTAGCLMRMTCERRWLRLTYVSLWWSVFFRVQVHGVVLPKLQAFMLSPTNPRAVWFMHRFGTRQENTCNRKVYQGSVSLLFLQYLDHTTFPTMTLQMSKTRHIHVPLVVLVTYLPLFQFTPV